MHPLILKYGELTLSVFVKTRTQDGSAGPYFDWLKCHVKASAKTMSTDFHWNVMPQELLRFADDLSGLFNEYPKRGSFEFRPSEPNVVLTFAIGSKGQVEGTYELRDDFLTPIVVKGSFEVDQNSLERGASSVRGFVNSLKSGAA